MAEISTTAVATQLKNAATRLWEIDTLRGLAIVQMVFYHFVWDLHFFGLYQGNIFSGPWQWFARTIATQFLFLVGISLTLSYNREVRSGETHLFFKYFLRGAKVFGWGLVITVGTYFFIGQGFVVFGILHLIGFSIMTSYPFLRLNRWLTLLIGLAMIGIGLYIDGIIVDYPWLIWLGLKQQGRAMVDYYPMLPYGGITLIGIFTGFTLYRDRLRQFSLPDFSDKPVVTGLRFLGRHSLVIYLIHQPILIAIFFALGFRP
ncbi:MAG: DUF1624 domain-containing protein [Anaerolineae bacterium]|nr:DUF1624 domain-containing protein [Anaerolineae bacterium]